MPRAFARPAKVDRSLLRIAQRANILASIRACLVEDGYIEVEVPELVVSTGACEDLDMYNVEMFGDLAFLRQTGQLYLEDVVIRGLPKAYCEGQSFRKEPASGDGRHLCEFRLIEIEKQNMDLEELVASEVRMLRYIIDHLSPDLFDEQTLDRLQADVEGEIPTITYREAIALLNRAGAELTFGDDISRANEQKLVRDFGKGGLAIVQHPTEVKFFNMLVNPDDPSVVDSCDLILRHGGETFGSSVRDTDPDSMRTRLHGKPMYQYMLNRAESFAAEAARLYNYTADEERREAQRIAAQIDQSFEDYFALIASNPVPRAGWGLGVARLFQYLFGTESIDEAVTFPVTRLSFRGQGQAFS
jgi:aspartyl/asparaginyl-tRNA synthetase